MSRRFVGLLFSVGVALCAAEASAIPGLQIYIDGATFDPMSETWIATDPDFDLWVIGDVGHVGTIFQVKLTASFYGLGPGSLTLTPISTSTVTDPSISDPVSFYGTGTGAHPALPDHGIFTDPTMHHWEDYLLGDFTLTDSPVGDFNGATPFPTSFPDAGQVSVYRVHIEGWSKVHFDAYDHTVSSLDAKETYYKAPFSHDGQVGVESMSWAGVKSLYQR